MSADPNLQTDISERHFPGDEEPTTQAAWIALATVLVFLAAILVYSLHLAAPDPNQEYTRYMDPEAHPMTGAQSHLDAARFCAALGDKLDTRRDAHLREAFQLDSALPGLEDELMMRFREKASRVVNAPAHVALAEWCLSFNLKSAAIEEYQAALATDRENAAALKALQELKK